MSYYVLARKWRPQMFSDLIGQQHVVKSLSYALSHDQVHHAYLFTGTRGVGKTSIARIFAKSLNCLTNGVSENPCGQCEHCLEISEGKFVDLIEVDAASRTGVEDTRELIDSIPYLPTKGRCKVYLIDEVHMFSNSSFNALLKTLEEPPEHVKFILATTDPDKLPITILSRCLQFNLKSLTKTQLVKHLELICVKESITFEKNALTMLAEAGSGSVRDTLSITDQALAYGQGRLALETVSEILGTTQPADIEAIVFAIATNNPIELHKLLVKLDDYDIDAKMLLTNIMRLLQSMAWMKEGIVREISPVLQGTLTDIPKPLLHLWYDIAANSLAELSNAQDEKALVDMTLLRMCAFVPDNWNPRKYTPVSVNDWSSNETDAKNSELPVNNQLPDHHEINSNKIENQESLTKQDNRELNTKNVLDELNVQDKSFEKDQNDTFEINGFANTLHAQPAMQSASLSDAEDIFIHQSLEDSKSLLENSKKENSEEVMPYIYPVNINESVNNELSDNELIEPNQLAESENSSRNFFSIDHSKMEELSSSSTLINEEILPWEEKSSIEILSKNETNNNVIGDNITRNTDKKTLLKENEGTSIEVFSTKSKDDEALTFEPAKKDSLIIEKSKSAQQIIEDKVNAFDWYKMIEVLPFKPLIRHCLSMGVLSVLFEKTRDQSYSVNSVFNISSHNSVLLTEQVTEDLISVLNGYFDCFVTVEINQTELNQPVPMEINQQKENNQQEQLVTDFNKLPEVNKLVDELGVEVLTHTIKKIIK